MFSPRIAFGALLSLATASLATSPDDATACTSFTLDGVNDTVITGRTFHPAGDVIDIGGAFSLVNTVNDLPPFCRLQLTITTNATANSSALTEVWLPAVEEWNGRFLTVGNGGYSGASEYSCPF